MESYQKALTLRSGSRDVVALASAHANLALAHMDADTLHLALQHGRAALDMSLDALQLGAIHTLRDKDIPQGSDAQQLLKTAATALLVQGAVHAEQGRECLTSYQGAKFLARHLVSGSESLAEQIHHTYASALQEELSRACSTRDDTLFHAKVFAHGARDAKSISSTALQQELAAGRTGKTSRRFLLGTQVEFQGPKKLEAMRNGLPMQSRLLRALAAACTLTLQCAFRCHGARRRMARQLVILPSNRHASARVQRVFRGHLARRILHKVFLQQRKSAALLLQSCVQRCIQHLALLRRLAIEADVHVPVASLHRPRWLPPVRTTALNPCTSVAVTARTLLAAVGLHTRTGMTQSLLGCTARLEELGCAADDVHTFTLLVHTEADGKITQEQFYTAILPVLLLTAEADDAEHVREACAVFDLMQPLAHTANPQRAQRAHGGVTRERCACLLSTLGYLDAEIDSLMAALDSDADLAPATNTPPSAHTAAAGEHGGGVALVTRKAFVQAMAEMLYRAQEVQRVELARRKVVGDVARYEPLHVLLCFARKRAALALQCAWRSRLSRARSDLFLFLSRHVSLTPLLLRSLSLSRLSCAIFFTLTLYLWIVCVCGSMFLSRSRSLLLLPLVG